MRGKMISMENTKPLHILLTNDDGHDAPGIQALSHALKNAGHRVTMVAPRNNQSATSMGVTSRRNLELFEIELDTWHLDGQPVDTVMVALKHLLEDNPPDLVVSGINFGPNLGTALYMSGTIGAAMMASLYGVPSIAVSAGMRFEEVGTNFQSTLDILDPAAEFIGSVVDSLSASADGDGRLLPRGILLNINYPALSREDIKGVLHPEVSAGHVIELGYHRCEKTGHVVPGFYPGCDPNQPDKTDGDIRAHLEGYITISAIRPHWNPPEDQAMLLRKRLDSLKFSI